MYSGRMKHVPSIGHTKLNGEANSCRCKEIFMLGLPAYISLSNLIGSAQSAYAMLLHACAYQSCAAHTLNYNSGITLTTC